MLYSKYQNSCQRVGASLLAHATSTSSAALGIMHVCLPWVICLAVKFSVLIIGYSFINLYFFLSFCTDKRSKSSAPGAIIRCRSRCGNSKLLVLAWCANFATQCYGLCLRALRNSLVEKRHSITVYK